MSVYFSSACSDLSRPKPDCLKPPNGALMSPLSKQFTQTTPARSARDTRWARETSFVHTAAARPYTVSLAIRIASSSSLNGIADSTGPKISSRARRCGRAWPGASGGEPFHFPLAGVAQEELAVFGRAGDRDEIAVHVAAERLAGGLAESGHALEHAVRDTGLARELGEPQRGQ